MIQIQFSRENYPETPREVFNKQQIQDSYKVQRILDIKEQEIKIEPIVFTSCSVKMNLTTEEDFDKGIKALQQAKDQFKSFVSI